MATNVSINALVATNVSINAFLGTNVSLNSFVTTNVSIHIVDPQMGRLAPNFFSETGFSQALLSS